MLLVNAPIPVPSVVWFPVTTGADVVLQQTPRAATAAPPSELILPPLAEVVVVIELIAVVVSVGIEIPGVVKVIKLTSLPYAVPALLVA